MLMKLHVQRSKAEFDVEVALTRAILAFAPNFLISRCCRGTAKLDLIQRRSGRNLATDVCVQSMSEWTCSCSISQGQCLLGFNLWAWVHHGCKPLLRWNLGTVTAVDSKSGSVHKLIDVYDVNILVSISQYIHIFIYTPMYPIISYLC